MLRSTAAFLVRTGFLIVLVPLDVCGFWPVLARGWHEPCLSTRTTDVVQLHVVLALALLSDWFRGDRQLNVTARRHRIPGDRSLTNHYARRCRSPIAVLDGDLRIGDSCADDRLRLCQVHANDHGHARRI
jgi:hypothetical protein